MQFVTTRRALALTLTLSALVLAGCSSGSSSSGGSTIAPSAAPNPGGQVALPAATSPVTAQLATNAYTAFKESVSISDIAIPSDPALADRAFVVEDDGTLRILDISGATPQLDRAVSLYSSLPAGSATGALRIQDAGLALVTTSGGSAEGVALFNPLTAQGTGDISTIPLGALTAVWPTGTLNSAGLDIGGQSLPLNYTSDAAASAGSLFITSSNFDPTFNNNPGTITAYTFNRTTFGISGGATIQTTSFNPTGITRVATPQGEVLLVTNTGAFAGTDASIDVIDPVAWTKVGTIRFPTGAPTNPVSRIVVSPDGRRGYVGSQSQPEVYVLDLEDVGLALGNQATADLSSRFLGGYTLNALSATSFVSSVALSHTGNYLYVVNFNESALHVIDLVDQADAGAVRGFERSGIPANFEGLANKIAVRPGTPGLSFQGPSIFAMTINLAAADRTVATVSVALDTVEVNKH